MGGSLGVVSIVWRANSASSSAASVGLKQVSLGQRQELLHSKVLTLLLPLLLVQKSLFQVIVRRSSVTGSVVEEGEKCDGTTQNVQNKNFTLSPVSFDHVNNFLFHSILRGRIFVGVKVRVCGRVRSLVSVLVIVSRRSRRGGTDCGEGRFRGNWPVVRLEDIKHVIHGF